MKRALRQYSLSLYGIPFHNSAFSTISQSSFYCQHDSCVFYIFLDFFLKICYIFRYSKLFPFEQYLFSEITSISYLHKDRSAHDKPEHTAQYPQFQHTHPVYEPVQDFPAHKTYNSDFPKDLPQLLCLYNP